MEILVDVVTESEALRKCNLASTQKWRDFLRSKLPFAETSGGKVYDKFSVQELAARIAEIPDEIRPPEQSLTSTRSTRPDGLTDRRGPACR